MKSRVLPIVLLLLAACSASPPNVVVIIVDDLGWKDTGVYGSDYYETPHIDQLAEEGLRFTQFYSANPVCSPTRASILTGRNPARLHITNWIGGSQNGMLRQAEYQRELPLEEVTLGEAFQAAGYTTGYLGKWHLGTEGYRAADQGFEFVRASNDTGSPGNYFAPYRHPNFVASNVPDLESDADSTYLTDRLTDLAIEFLETHQKEPFLLVLSHYGVHTPLQSKPAMTDRFVNPDAEPTPFMPELYDAMTRAAQDHATYAGMIASVDASVGRITEALRELNLTERTTIVFTSDNGGLSTLSNGRQWAPTANLPLRAGKGWLYEGGIRIPLIIYSSKVERGTYSKPGTTDDLMPTLLALAGLPPTDSTDGADLFTLASVNRPLYWHFPHYHGSGNRPSGAIRAGDYKLIEWFETGGIELYNLAADPEELNDMSGSLPAVADSLHILLHTWRSNLEAQMPTPNPDYEVPTSR